MKTCNKCAIEKEDGRFYKNRRVCKKCISAYSAAWQQSAAGKALIKGYKAKYRATKKGAAKDKEYRESDAGRAAQIKGKAKYKARYPGRAAEHQKTYYARFPERKAAKDALRAAVRYGKINKPNNCQECGQIALI